MLSNIYLFHYVIYHLFGSLLSSRVFLVRYYIIQNFIASLLCHWFTIMSFRIPLLHYVIQYLFGSLLSHLKFNWFIIISCGTYLVHYYPMRNLVAHYVIQYYICSLLRHLECNWFITMPSEISWFVTMPSEISWFGTMPPRISWVHYDAIQNLIGLLLCLLEFVHYYAIQN